MESSYLEALALTLIVELGALAALLVPLRARLGLSARRLGLLLLLALATNLVSHRCFWLLFPHLSGGWAQRLTVAEAVVALAEGSVYAGVGRLRPVWLAIGASAVANLLSWTAGAWLL